VGVTAFAWAVAGGTVAALLGWLINRFSHPAWLTKRRSIALTAVLVVAAGAISVIAGGPIGNSSDSPTARRSAEEKLVERLDPGQTFSSLKQLLGGQEPDRQSRLATGFIARFDRTWEYITTVVDADGNTSSIAVVRKDQHFRPKTIGAWPAPFGRTIADYEHETPSITGLAGYCGGKHALYLEVVDTIRVPASRRLESIAFGNMDEGPIDCGSPEAVQCDPAETGSTFSFEQCLTTSHWDGPDGRQLRQSTQVWAVVVTAPDRHLTPDMVRLPDEIGP
jgi:hypothetical protein